MMTPPECRARTALCFPNPSPFIFTSHVVKPRALACRHGNPLISTLLIKVINQRPRQGSLQDHEKVPISTHTQPGNISPGRPATITELSHTSTPGET